MAIDDAAPVLQTATVDAHAITLTYDEPLYDSKPPPSTAFSVKVDGIASTIRSTQVNQLAVKLYLHDPVGAATVTLDYTVPPGTPAESTTSQATWPLPSATKR